MTSVTIAILNYNGISHLKNYLPSVLSFSEGFNVAVIDNGSSDDSVSFLQKNYPEVSLILLDKNYGYCEGYNLGLRDLHSEFYVLLNSDVEVTPGWIDPIISMMKNNSGIAACQPKILSLQERNKFEYAGAAGGFIDWLGYPFCRGRLFNHVEEDMGQYDKPSKVFWASGACFFVRASLFRQFGGFNTAFFAHMEEIDLCWRLQRAGYSIWCNPDSKVYHLGGGTLEKSSARKTYLNFRNNLATVVNNLPAGKLFYVLPLRFFLDVTASVSFIFSGGVHHFLAVYKAYLALPAAINRTVNTREEKPTGITGQSVVFGYFLRGIRKFSELKPF